jgi:uncharacterized membrane-anchored protein
MTLRLKLAAVWMTLQVALFGLWAASEEARFAPDAGTSILVEVVPVDPRDLLRGQYFQLSFKFSRPDTYNAELPTDFNEIPEGASVWVVLGPSGRYHVPRRVELSTPANLAPDEIVVRGRKDGWSFTFGIERYFVPEGTETPNPEDLTVRLRVADDGSVRIEEVLLNNRTWP